MALHDRVTTNESEATELTAGKLAYHNKQDIVVAGSGNYTAGTITVERINDSVIITGHNILSHPSATVSQTAVGLLPTWARPRATVVNVYYMTNSHVSRIILYSNGQFGTNYLNWAGTSVAQSNTSVAPTITYNVDSI